MPRLLLRIGDDGVAADHHMGLGELFRGFKFLPVNRHRLHQGPGCKMRGKSKRQTQHTGELRAEQAGAQYPQGHIGVLARDRVDRLVFLRRAKQSL